MNTQSKKLSEVSKLDRTLFPDNYVSGKARRTVWEVKRDSLYEWLLTDVQAYELIIGDCSYCGSPSEWPFKRNGIDRVDSLKDYTVDNCVTACKICNRAKNNLSIGEFKEWISRIVKYNAPFDTENSHDNSRR